MSLARKIVIVGGHGNVALRLATLLSPKHSVTSVIRTKEHEADIKDTGAFPHILSLEESPVSDFTSLFEDKNVVYFSAGAGGKGGADRTKAVDYEGALKVFDALEAVKSEPKPRLILVSAVDVRDPEKIPEHYTQADIDVSERMRAAIPAYMHWKYEADKNLSKRTAFKWSILRPGGLTNNPGTGKASIGITHITESISRDDVAAALAALVDREDAHGLAIDIVGGDTPIEEGIDAAIKKGVSAFSG